MSKHTILMASTLIAGIMLVGLLIVAVSLAAPLLPDTGLIQSDASFLGEDASERSSYSIARAGDVNRDGYSDFLIGALYNDDGGIGAGQTYLVLGKASGWAMDADLGQVNASFWGEDAGDQSGCSVAGAGDVNGDGYDDFVIGARGDDTSTTITDTGKTYLILGQASGWSMDTDLSQADASLLGEGTADQSGYSVAGAGDVNGDGYADFLVGAPYHGEIDAGRTYLIIGRPTISWTVGMRLADANAFFSGEAGGDRSGYSVASAGDVNGDGYHDFLIGAPYNDDGGADAGQTYLLLGRPTISWTVGMSLTTDANASFLGAEAGDQAGYSVAGAGDVNGDGYDDFLVGAWYNGENGATAGQTYLVLGRAAADWGMNFDLSNADASFWGEMGSDWSGWSVSGAGDVNGDGYADFLIGAYGNDAGGNLAGQAYLVLGRAAADWESDFSLSDADVSFWGEDEGDFAGYSVSQAGDVNGDGFDDFLVGARNDEEGGSEAGQTYLILGNGLSLRKTASASPVLAGETVTYSLSYSNTMYITATGVVITDRVPANTTYVRCTGGLSCDESNGVVTWSVGDVISRTGGVVTLAVQANPGLCADTVITNTARISATNTLNPLVATATDTVVVTPTAGFTSNTPVCLGTSMVFTDTSQCAVAWLWNFGDGVGISNAQNPRYTYITAGNHTVTLTVTNASGRSDNYQAVVTVNSLPTVGFTSNSPVCLGRTMVFTNTSSGAVSYQWNFGDGTGSTAASPTHRYLQAGTYTVVLTATNASGCSNVFTRPVTVNGLPTAGFTSNSPVCLGRTMVFTNTSSGAVSYQWSFGDGTGSTAASPTHRYLLAGAYTVVLTATTSSGCRDVYSDTVVVRGLPTADFRFSVDGLKVIFTNTSTGASNYLWDFGDGVGTSTDANPVYIYQAMGTYTVELKASNVYGCSDTYQTAVGIYYHVYLPIAVRNLAP